MKTKWIELFNNIEQLSVEKLLRAYNEMSLYKEFKKFVKQHIKFDDNFPKELREHVIEDFADCIEEYINEYIDQIPSDQKQKEYLFDLVFRYCIEAYYDYDDDDDEFYDDDDEFYDDDDLD